MSTDKYLLNRLGNCKNQHQGETLRVLCVCSAGLLRSPTAAVVLSQPPFNFNTRAAGLVPQFALIPVDQVLLEWADEIVCMELEQKEILSSMTKTPIICLEIEDSFPYRDPALMELIHKKYLIAVAQDEAQVKTKEVKPTTPERTC